MQLIKYFSSFFKIARYVRKKAAKNYTIYSSLKTLGLTEKNSHFDTLYNDALFDFENKQAKHPLLVDLLKERTVKASFKDDLYNKTSDGFFNDLNASIASKDKYREIRDEKINLLKEINEFSEIFSLKVYESRLPKEKEESDKLDDIKALIIAGFAPNESIDISEHISEISKLRDDNKHQAVLKLLISFKTKKWDSISKELKYKVALNFAITYFELGQKKEGAKYFIELLEYKIKPEQAFALAALGYSLINDFENAILFANRAIELDDQNENAYLALLFSKEDTLEVADIDIIIPKEMQSRPVIAINIGTFKEKKNDFIGAFEIFSKLDSEYEKLDSFKCDIIVQLANNRINSITKSDDYFFQQLNDENRSKLQFAFNKLNTAWEYLKNTDLNRSRSYVQANRGVVYKVLGEPEKAEKDLKESLELKESYFAYRHLLEIYSQRPKEFDEVISKLEVLPLSDQEKQELILFRAVKASRDDTIINILPELVNSLPNIEDANTQNKFYTLISDFFVNLKNFPEAEKYALELAKRNDKDAYPFFLLGKLYINNGDLALGEDYLRKSIELTNENPLTSTIWALSELLIYIGDFAKAAQVLRLVADINIFSQLTKSLITVEYKAGNYREAHSLATELLSKNQNEPFLVDIIASIYEATEKFDEAIEILESYIKERPNDNYMLVKLAMNLYKKSEFKEGLKVLDRITDYDKIPIEAQFLIADAYIKGKEYTKGLEIGYRLRLDNYSDQNVHNLYIQIQTHITDLKQEDYFPNFISIDTYVVLVDEAGKKLEFIIVITPKYKDEIAATEKLSKNLIGKRLHEQVQLNDVNYKIDSILWKYTYALHDSMAQIGTRFNNEGPIRIMTLGSGQNIEDKLSNFFQNIDQGIDQDKTIENFYRNGQSTIGVNASLSGLSPIKYWGKLINTPDLGIFSIGTNVELRIGEGLLMNGQPLVFDIISLLTLYHIRAFELIQKLPNKKFVSRSTIEIIKEEIEEIRSRQDSEHIIVNKIGNQYYRHIVKPEEKKKQIENLSKLLEEIIAIAEVITPALPDNYKDKIDKDKLLGKTFNESALIAVEKSALLVSDDAFFRQIFFNEKGCNGISTIIILIYLLKNNLIAINDLNNYYEKLIRLNYRFVPVSDNLLLKICQGENYNVNGPFEIACDIINPAFLRDLQAVKLVGDFLLVLYKTLMISPIRNLVAQYVLNKLFMGRNRIVIRRLIIPYIDTKFLLLPLQKDEIMEILKVF